LASLSHEQEAPQAICVIKFLLGLVSAHRTAGIAGTVIACGYLSGN
jgi:hypothetical protein